MENYKHILLAVDFYEHCEAVANRAKDMAIKYQAKLSIIHVVDSLPITDAGLWGGYSFQYGFNSRVDGRGKKEAG